MNDQEWEEVKERGIKENDPLLGLYKSFEQLSEDEQEAIYDILNNRTR